MQILDLKGEYQGDGGLPRSNPHIIRRSLTDAFQTTMMTYITNGFFPWLCLALIFNRKDRKRPVIMILILYWFLQSTGNLFQSYLSYTDQYQYQIWGYAWPYTPFNWYIVNVIPYIFWESGEIIADWYPLLRTKALIQNKRKMRPIYFICILYNMVKVMHIVVNFKYAPSHFKIDESGSNQEILKHKTAWWAITTLLQCVSILYDISVIIALKNTLFDKLEGLKNKANNFLEKFKQISEFRIFVSIIISLISFPFVVLQVYYYFDWLFHPDKKMVDINDYVEFIRIAILRFVYTFMYIDQILLRFYVKQNKSNYYLNSVKDNSVDSQRLIPNTPPTYNNSPSFLTPNPASSVCDSVGNSNESAVNSVGNTNFNSLSLPRSNNYFNNMNFIPYNNNKETKSNYYLQNLKEINNNNNNNNYNNNNNNIHHLYK